jgi:site-specific DNA recombinase
MKNVLVYTRVSTDDQADHGFSLRHQERVILHYCQHHKYNVLKIYEEDHSAKDFNRPKWKELMFYCQKNKQSVDAIIFLRWDRFSRNMHESLTTITRLQNLGIKVVSVEQPIDMDIPDNQLMLSIYLTVPEIENKKNSIRTTEGSRSARLAGCWTGTAPIGYNNHRLGDKSSLIKNDKAELVVEAFKLVAHNTHSADHIRKQLVKKGLKLSKQAFLNMLRNVVYIGKIKVKQYKKEEAVEVVALHEPIIDQNLFTAVQNVLAGKKGKRLQDSSNSDIFPLRGSLLCSECNKPLTGGASRGRNRYYNYYKCQDNCIPNIPAEDANVEFGRFLSTVKIDAGVTMLYQKVVEDVFKRNEGDYKAKAAKITQRLNELDNGLEKAQEEFFVKGTISQVEFNNAVSFLQKRKLEVEYQLQEFTSNGDDFLLYSKAVFPFLTNLDKYYNEGELNVKKFIIGSIFPEKVYFSKSGYRTTKLNSVITLLASISQGLNVNQSKKATEICGLSSEAPPAGLEPATL